MKRRSFLGFLGGAAVAGPQAAKSAAQMTMVDLQIPHLGDGVPSHGLFSSKAASSYDPKEWARDALNKLTGRSAMEAAKRRREYQIYALDANVAALRSMTLVNKMRLSKEVQFARSERDYRSHLEGIIAGWWE